MTTMTKVCPVLLCILATVGFVSSNCPSDKRRFLSKCNYEIQCWSNINGAWLPNECRGSTNYPVSVSLTLLDAEDNYDEQSSSTDINFLTSVTSLTLSGNWEETNLSILKYTPRIVNFYLVNNDISFIYGQPFHCLGDLELIDLSWNKLKHVKDLFHINCSPKKIKKLNLAHNLVEYIDVDAFRDLSTLVEFDMSHNHISYLTNDTFDHLTSLKILRLNNNQIEHLNKSLDNLQSLRHLYLTDNHIKHLDQRTFKTIHALLTLDVSHNKLTSLAPFIFIRHWNHINRNSTCKIIFSGNHITSMANAAFSFEISQKYQPRNDDTLDVTTLDLSHNAIDDIPYFAFQPIYKLSELIMSHNKLTRFLVDPYDLKYIKHLDLSSNNINNLNNVAFTGMYNLQMVDLSHNKLKYIPDHTFRNNSHLNKLIMTHNDFGELINLNMAIAEVSLDLSSNKLYKMNIVKNNEFYAYELRLDKNNIVNTSLIDLKWTNLQRLTICHNYIQILNKDSLLLPETLSYLDLSYNYIRIIDTDSFHRVKNLETLLLANNNITSIQYGSFQGLQNLTWLDLSFNKIDYLDSKALMDLKFLQQLWLRSNGLYSLDYKVWLGHKFVVKVFVDDNFLRCDWLSTALSDFHNGVSKMQPVLLQMNLGSTTGHSLEGIPCVYRDTENKEFERLTPEFGGEVDERLLVLTSKILEAIQYQNVLLEKFKDDQLNCVPPCTEACTMQCSCPCIESSPSPTNESYPSGVDDAEYSITNVV